MAILLSAPGRDFTGGEFVLTEQRPRTQSRVEVVPLVQGEAVIFAVNLRPTRGSRGYYRVAMRHGVSRLRSGSATRSGSSSRRRIGYGVSGYRSSPHLARSTAATSRQLQSGVENGRPLRAPAALC